MRIPAIHFVRRAMVLAIVAVAPVAATAAEDFTRYSNEQLIQRRNEIQDMGEADRLRYREEMQNRIQMMTPEERNRLGIGSNDDAVQDTQTRERTAEDNERGRGELKRERERTEQGEGGYGRGYETRQSGNNGSFGGRGAGGGGGGHGR